jgi:hypothetical protein
VVETAAAAIVDARHIAHHQLGNIHIQAGLECIASQGVVLQDPAVRCPSGLAQAVLEMRRDTQDGHIRYFRGCVTYYSYISILA